ncbi:MAG: lipoyl(octanoyl) transferase LipB [Patescibacteria group bacterium]
MKQLTVYDWRNNENLYNPSLPYEHFITAQKTIIHQRLNREHGDILILTTHPPTITLGARSVREQLIHIRALPSHITDADTMIPDEELLRQSVAYLRHFYDINLVKTNRGGSVWYHDNGVLQLYLIMEVPPFGVTNIVYSLEETLLRMLNDIGIPATRADESMRRTDKSFLGLWVNEKKIAAIGMRAQCHNGRFISMFGASLNINPCLPACNLIDPCGIPNRQMTSVAAELHNNYSVNDVRLTSLLYKHISNIFDVTIVK